MTLKETVPQGLASIAGMRVCGKEQGKYLLLFERVPLSTPPPIRRAVLKDAASASEKKTPGHALMRGGESQLTEK